MTFDDALIETYLLERGRLGELAPGSIVVTRWCLRSLQSFVGPIDLESVTRNMLRDWLASRGDLRPSSIKSMITKVRPFFTWCVDRDLLLRSPAAALRTPPIPEGLPRNLDPEEVALVLAHCPDERARTTVLIMPQCGLRIGEVASMRMSDVDRRRRIAGVRGKGGRGGITRTVNLPEELLEQMNRYPGARRTGPLIASYRPPYDHVSAHWLSKLVSRWMRDAGVKVEAHDGNSAHAFRHTAAQDLVDAGRPPRVVQVALGHRSIRSSEIYWRRDPPGMREAIEGRRYG